MNNKVSAILIFLGVAMVGFNSCSDGNDGPVGSIDSGHVAEVFPAGLPKSVAGTNIKADALGRVSEIVSTVFDGLETVSSTVKFDYSPVSRAGYDMTMSLYEGDALDATFYIRLNEAGFIKHALEVYADDEEADEDTWDFEYNSDGQLKSMKRGEGNEETTITYMNGNITKVAVFDHGSNSSDETIFLYVNSDMETPMVNKGGIMLYDYCFNIDMDEMGVAYFAGLLGKATKNLPLRNESLEEMYPGQTRLYGIDFAWSLNADGLPVCLAAKDDDGYADAPIAFVW